MSFWYRTLWLVLKLIFGSIAVGSLVGLILPFIIKLFSLDKLFELWELLLTLLIIITILVLFIRFLTHYLSRIIDIKPLIDFNFKQFKFLIIPGILTCIMPIEAILFSENPGNKPIWLLLVAGIVGSLFWSLPLILWILISSLFKRIK